MPTGKYFPTFLHLQEETVEVLGTTYQSTRPNSPEQMNLQQHRWEKLKSRFNSFLRCPVNLPSVLAKQVGLTVCELPRRIYKKKITRLFIHIIVLTRRRNGVEWMLWRSAFVWTLTTRSPSMAYQATLRSPALVVLCTCRSISTDNRKVVGIGMVLKLQLTT